jgi:hypothetical protein
MHVPFAYEYTRLLLREILHRLNPISYLQQQFRNCGPFLASLFQTESNITSIPSISAVRWYNSNALFLYFLAIWEYMESFAIDENSAIPQLNLAVPSDLHRLAT